MTTLAPYKFFQNGSRRGQKGKQGRTQKVGLLRLAQNMTTLLTLSNSRPSQTGPKRGSRVIKPKKASLIAQQKIKKKHTAGLTAQTEKMLAGKAGHLEMLRGGKKDKNKEAKSG